MADKVMTQEEYIRIQSKIDNGENIRTACGNETIRRRYYAFKRSLSIPTDQEIDKKVRQTYRLVSEEMDNTLKKVTEDIERKNEQVKEFMRKTANMPQDRLTLHGMIKVGVMQSIVRGLAEDEPWAVREGLSYLKSVDDEYKEKAKGNNFTPDDYKKMLTGIKKGGKNGHSENISTTQAN